MWYEYEIWAAAHDKAFRFSITQSRLSVLPDARMFGKINIPVEKQQRESRSLSNTSVSEKRYREPRDPYFAVLIISYKHPKIVKSLYILVLSILSIHI